MKKKTIRLLAMILCVLSITALLPTVAFAADANVDKVETVALKIADNAKTAVQAKVMSNASYASTRTIRARVGEKWTMVTWSPSYFRSYGLTVKYQWYVKKGSGRSWSKLSGATKYKYSFKATKSKNGWQYRVKITNKRNSGDYIYCLWKIKVS